MRWSRPARICQRLLEAHRLALGPPQLEGFVAELPGGRLARILERVERVWDLEAEPAPPGRFGPG
jgi:hypothetical protein